MKIENITMSEQEFSEEVMTTNMDEIETIYRSIIQTCMVKIIDYRKIVSICGYIYVSEMLESKIGVDTIIDHTYDLIGAFDPVNQNKEALKKKYEKRFRKWKNAQARP